MWSIAKVLASSLSLSDSLSAIAITIEIAIAFSVIALSLTTHCSSLIAHSSHPNVVLASNQLYCQSSCYGFGGACELLQCEMFCKCHFFLIFKNLFIYFSFVVDIPSIVLLLHCSRIR